MKNHFSFILAALAIASLSGCVNVSTDVQTYYPSLSPTSVVVLENKERLPEEAEPIGTLKTSKYGNDCHHESLLRKAIMATAASGGNILRISSAPEDSCHEINGVIARMPEGSAVPYDITVPHPARR